MTIATRDIDWTSESGAALAASLPDGPLRDVIPHLASAFLMRSTWAPGGRFVGALVEGGVTLSVTGGGADLTGALTSCLGEAAERLTMLAPAVPDRVAASFASIASSQPESWRSALKEGLTEEAIAADEPLDWVAGTLAGSGGAILVPMAWRDGWFRRARGGLPSSVGVAAGATQADAQTRAMFELIERDAVARWWSGERQPRAVPAELLAACAVVPALRGASSERRTLVLDIAGPDDPPVMVACSTGPDGGGLAAGAACRPGRIEAIEAAFTELCQAEIGLVLARARQAGQIAGKISEEDRHHLARAERLDVGMDRRFRASLNGSGPVFGLDVARTGEHLASKGFVIGLVTLRHPRLGVATVRAVAPRLRGYPDGSHLVATAVGHSGETPYSERDGSVRIL